MKVGPKWLRHSIHLAAALGLALGAGSAQAGNGYFILGYGPMAHQSAGTATAMGLDGFSGSSNPGKLSAVDSRLDLGVLLFMPYRRIQRTGSDTPYDFISTSRNSFFALPEVGYAQRINDTLSWGVTIYGNGGLNTEYADTTGIPDTNANPQRCGSEPGNFFFGCGKLGFDLSQLIVAPTLSWEFKPGHSIGVSPLLAYQRFKAYGFQAFEGVSAFPNEVTNRGYDEGFGAGVRVGWFGRITPWLDVGAAYATQVHMEKFNKYRGLLADGGAFDVPSNFSVGFAVRPLKGWTFGGDVQRIFYGDIKALSNGVLASLADPENSPLGSRSGSGFNWRHLTNYKLAVAYEATPELTVRAGFLYGRRPQADSSANSVSFNMFAPNPLRQITAGFTWAFNPKNDLQFAYGRYLRGTYRGPSATAGLGVGGEESVTPYVNTVMLGWTRHF